MATVATELGGKIDAVRAEKERLDSIKQEVMQARSRNSKVERLIRRLDDCDANISSLLSQAADCLETLVDTAMHSGPSSSRQLAHNEKTLVVFENRAQEWFATLHDVQLGLRSATKNLHKARQAPLAIDVSEQGNNRISNAQLGSAGRGHSLSFSSQSIDSPIRTESRRGSDSSIKTVITAPAMSNSMSTDWNVEQPRGRRSPPTLQDNNSGHTSLLGAFAGGQTIQMQSYNDQSQEASLSLSTLRQQEQSWRQLAGALTQVADKQDIYRDSEKQMARDLIAHHTADNRLMSALLRLHMEVLPETHITPMTATKSNLS
jgi:hypothetical protein